MVGNGLPEAPGHEKPSGLMASSKCTVQMQPDNRIRIDSPPLTPPLNHPDSALIILPEVERITPSTVLNPERAFIVIRVG